MRRRVNIVRVYGLAVYLQVVGIIVIFLESRKESYECMYIHTLQFDLICLAFV